MRKIHLIHLLNTCIDYSYTNTSKSYKFLLFVGLKTKYGTFKYQEIQADNPV